MRCDDANGLPMGAKDGPVKALRPMVCHSSFITTLALDSAECFSRKWPQDAHEILLYVALWIESLRHDCGLNASA